MLWGHGCILQLQSTVQNSLYIGLSIAVIDEINERKTGEKSKIPGQKFAFLTISDNSASIQNVALWPENYEKFKQDIFEGCVATLYLNKNNWNGASCFIHF